MSAPVSVFLRALRTQPLLSLALVAMFAAVLGAPCAQAQTESVLANFTGTSGAALGAGPQYGNLIQASDGNFYGMTYQGGASNYGAAFQMTPAGAVTLLHSFAGGTSDGEHPYGSLVEGTDGNFYGMTAMGGAHSDGAAFQMTPAGAVTLLHSFAGATDGANPYGSLVQGTDGNFYGMTPAGGASGYGAAFQMTPAGAVTPLHSFAGTADGEHPQGSLVQGTDGNFYGMTSMGGAHTYGAAFKMTPTGTFLLLHSFGPTDGEHPYGSLVQGTDGNFYGMTIAGGANSNGAVFQMTPAGTVTLLHSFAGGAADGRNTYGSLVQGTDGNFYGMTPFGGANNGGVVFQMTPAGAVTLLHSFAVGTGDGYGSNGTMVQGTDGNFYGMTAGGGSSSDGVIFKQTTATTLAAPVALSSTATTVAPSGTFTLTYSVANAYTGATNGTNAGSSSLGYCFASNTASNATWTGVITGSATSATSPSLNAPSTAGTYAYSLTCGGMESNLVTLTVVSPVPTVTGVSPTSGLVNGGTSVTITGTNFTGATAVKFGTANARSYTVNLATSITAVSPAGAAGAVDVTVRTANGTSATGSADQFTYLRASVTFGTMSFSPAATEPQGTSQAIAISEAVTYGGAQPTGAVTFVLNGVTYTATCTTAGSPETCTATVPAATIAALTAAGYTVTAALAQDSAYSAGSGTSGTFTISPPPAVGVPSATQTTYVTFTTAGTLGQINVLTQGAANKDFKFVSGGTCATGTAYAVNATCTVFYTFTPSRPGQRLGAVSLTTGSSSSATLLGASLLTGTGTGPLVTFPGSTTLSSVGSGFSGPSAAVVDGSGDVFVADTFNNAVKEIVAVNGVVTSSSAVNTVGSGFYQPFGVAVDGSGDVFVADNGNSAVKEIVAVNGVVTSNSTVKTVGSGFGYPDGMAVDGSGDVFVADNGNSAVYEIVAVNGVVTSSSTVNTVGGGFAYPFGVAVDGSGDVFVADSSNYAVYEIVAVNGVVTSSSIMNTVGSGFYQPYGVAVDGSGDVFVADGGNNAVKEIVAVNGVVTSSSTVNTVGSGFSYPEGVAVDGSGHLFVADSGNNAVKTVDLTAAPSLAFAATSVGATSSDSPRSVSVQNEGNAPLTFASFATGTTSFKVSGTGTCRASTPLAESSVCTVAASFTPMQAGSPFTDYLTLTDNSLNATGSTQTVSLSGTATAGSKTITFTQPASPVAAGSSATLVATASNGDPVTFSVTPGTGTATIVNGNVVVYQTVGTVTVNANSAANSNYNSAPTVSYGVTIQSLPLVFLAGSGKVASLSSTGGVTSSGVAGGGIGAAVDASGYVWSVNSGGGGVTNLTPAGALGNSYTSIGLSGATALAIDGNSKVLIANGNGKTTVLSNAGAVVSTTQGSTSAGGSGVAVDLSGNVWVANPSANSVDEIIGGASPAAPLATAVQSATSGTRP